MASVSMISLVYFGYVDFRNISVKVAIDNIIPAPKKRRKKRKENPNNNKMK